MAKLLSMLALALTISVTANAEELQEHNMMMNHGDGHLMDMDGGMVMGQNTDTLPGGCDKIAATKEITVRAGHKYSEKFPGRMFAFDTQEFKFEPCTKLTVHFINEDHIRHQWMMHGLPKYLYPKGMFHLELTGPGKISGTLILPPGDQTYLVHCDIAQHMEKGMKAQLKVGKGSGDLPSIPGLTDYAVADDYSDKPAVLPNDMVTEAAVVAAPTSDTGAANAPASAMANKKLSPAEAEGLLSGTTVIGLAVGLLLAIFLAPKFKGQTLSEGVSTVFALIGDGVAKLFKGINWLIGLVFSNSKALPQK